MGGFYDIVLPTLNKIIVAAGALCLMIVGRGHDFSETHRESGIMHLRVVGKLIFRSGLPNPCFFSGIPPSKSHTAHNLM